MNLLWSSLMTLGLIGLTTGLIFLDQIRLNYAEWNLGMFKPEKHSGELGQWYADGYIQDRCGHSPFGACNNPCPRCNIYGFYYAYRADQRWYWLCKWCGYGKDVDGQEFKCVWEKCHKCLPRVRRSNLAAGKVDSSQEVGMRFTMSPGHPCPKCGTKMKIWRPKFNPMLKWKNEIYEIHGYQHQKDSI